MMPSRMMIVPRSIAGVAIGKIFALVMAIRPLVGDGVRAQRMMVPDHDVGVLAGLERADAAVDSKLLRWIDRHQRERLVVAQSAPLHRLRRLGIQAAGVLGAVRVDGDDDALAR